MGIGATAILGSLIVEVATDSRKYNTGMLRVAKLAVGTSAAISVAMGIAGVAVLGMSKKAISAANEFMVAMRPVNVMMSGMVAAQKELADGALEMSTKYGQAVELVAKQTFTLVSGLGAANVTLKKQQIAARLAAAGFDEMGDSTELLVSTARAYGDTSDAMLEKTSDLVFKINEIAQTSIPRLAGAFPKAAATAANLGIEVEQVAALFAAFSGTLGSTEEVGTKIESLMGGLMKQTKPMQKAIRDLGEEFGFVGAEGLIATFGLDGAMRKLTATTDGSVESLAKLFRRKEALSLAMALAGKQADAFTGALSEMNNVAGASEKAAKGMEDSAKRNADEFNRTRNIMIQYGQSLTWFQEIMTAITATFNTLISIGLPFVQGLKLIVDWYVKIGNLLGEIIWKTDRWKDLNMDTLRASVAATAKEANVLSLALERINTGVEISSGQKKLMLLKLTKEQAEIEERIGDNRRAASSADVQRLTLLKKVIARLGEIETRTGDIIQAEKKAEENRVAAELRAAEAAAKRRKAAEEAAKKAAAARQAHIDSIKSTGQVLATEMDDLAIKARKDFAFFKGDLDKVAKANEQTITSLITKHLELGLAVDDWLMSLSKFLPVVSTKMRDLSKDTVDFTEELKAIKAVADDLGPPLEHVGEITDEAFDQKRLLDAERYKEGIKELTDEISETISALDSMIASLEKMGVTGLENISGLLSGMQSFSNAAQAFSEGKTMAGIAGVVSGAVSVGMSLFAKGGMFGSATDESLLASQGKQAGAIFGNAWSAEAASSMANLSKTLKTKGGQADVLAAMWHPETVKEILAKVTDMGKKVQDEWAANLEHKVKPVLISTMGMKESEAAQAMAPLFNEILEKIGPNGKISDEMRRMIDWAKGVGVALGDGLDSAAESKSFRELGDTLADIRLKQLSIEDQIAEKKKRARKQFRGGLNEELMAKAKLAAADGELSQQEAEMFKARGREQERFLLESFKLFQTQGDLLNSNLETNQLLSDKLGMLGEELALVTAIASGYETIAGLTGYGGRGSSGPGGGRSGLGASRNGVDSFTEINRVDTVHANLYMNEKLIATEVINLSEQMTRTNSSESKSTTIRPKGDLN